MSAPVEATVTEIFTALKVAWDETRTDEERLDVIRASLETAVSFLRQAAGDLRLFPPLDELAFALEKLATKPDDTIRDFLHRDDTGAQLAPAIELQAYYVLVYRIFRSVSPKRSERSATDETIKALSRLPSRCASTIRNWHARIEFADTPARQHFLELLEIAQRQGYFGLSIARARHEVGIIAQTAAAQLFPPPE
jgi:hypothetical protein